MHGKARLTRRKAKKSGAFDASTYHFQPSPDPRRAIRVPRGIPRAAHSALSDGSEVKEDAWDEQTPPESEVSLPFDRS